MAHEFLLAQDATLFAAQDPEAMLQIGAIVLFPAAPLQDASGRLRLDDLRRHMQGRLASVPRFRQRLIHTPFALGPPAWIDDEAFAIENHVRAVALAAPGDERQLQELAGRLFETPLDSHRPMWELWFVEGIAGDRVGLVLKTSHVMADGMALLTFAFAVLDDEPHDEIDDRATPAPRGAPSPIELMASGRYESTRRSLGATRSLIAHVANPRRLSAWAGSFAGAIGRGSLLAPSLPITSPVGRQRDLAWVREPLADLREVKQRLDVTLNDVALGIVAGALRTYLGEKGLAVDELRPRALVPVSRHEGLDDMMENRFSIMLTTLPVSHADPVERVRVVHAEMARHKQRSDPATSELLFRASDLVPLPLLRAFVPSILRHQPLTNLAVTNIPGSPTAMYLLGARALEMYPMITVTGNIALIVGVLSYEDTLGISITVDADVIDDVETLVDAIDRSTHALIDAVLGTAGIAAGGT